MKRLTAAFLIFVIIIAVCVLQAVKVNAYTEKMTAYVDRIEDLRNRGETEKSLSAANELYDYFNGKKFAVDLFFKEDRVAELELAILLVQSGVTSLDDSDFSAEINALRFAVSEMRRISGLDLRNIC